MENNNVPVDKYIDAAGVDVYPRDIVIYTTGGAMDRTGYQYWYRIAEVPYIADGRGYKYSIIGDNHPFYHLDVSTSYKVILSEEMLWNFHHGNDTFLSPVLFDGTNLIEVLAGSDYDYNWPTLEMVNEYILREQNGN